MRCSIVFRVQADFRRSARHDESTLGLQYFATSTWNLLNHARPAVDIMAKQRHQTYNHTLILYRFSNPHVTRVPARIVPEPGSKLWQPFTFLCQLGCNYLKDSLQERRSKGERFTSRSPVIIAQSPNAIAYAVKMVIRVAGLDFKPTICESTSKPNSCGPNMMRCCPANSEISLKDMSRRMSS
jgi:hypothetical protein